MVKAPLLDLYFLRVLNVCVRGERGCSSLDKEWVHKVQFHGKHSLETYERMWLHVKLVLQLKRFTER